MFTLKKSPAFRAFAFALLGSFIPASAHAASYTFTWNGANGYKIEGAFSIPDNMAGKAHITEGAVDCFWIKGSREDTQLGRWSLGQLTPETSWGINFEPATLKFRIGDHSASPYGQEWNMNGNGTGCGVNGLGFNAGGAAQDICVNNVFIRSSQVPSSTPLAAMRDDNIRFKSADCNIVLVS